MGVSAIYLKHKESTNHNRSKGRFFIGVNMTEELLRLKNTARVLDISRSTLLRRMKDDKDFPEPIKIGRFLYWKSTDIQRYIDCKQAKMAN